MAPLEDDLYFKTTHTPLLLRKNHLTVSAIKLNFMMKTSSMLYLLKRHLKYQKL